MNQTVICPHCFSPIVETSALASGPITCPDCAETVEASQVAGQTPEWVAEKTAAGFQRPAVHREFHLASESKFWTITVTGNHWLLDAVGGWLVLAAAWAIVVACERWRAARATGSRS